jgi:hypothetical protein
MLQLVGPHARLQPMIGATVQDGQGAAHWRRGVAGVILKTDGAKAPQLAPTTHI